MIAKIVLWIAGLLVAAAYGWPLLMLMADRGPERKPEGLLDAMARGTEGASDLEGAP